MERSRRRMGGLFYVKPYQVHDKLKKLGGNLHCFYDGILRNAIIKEDWERSSVWVSGKFQATAQQLGKWTGKSKNYARILLNKLVKAGMIVETADGSYELPMYKRKQDEGVRASDIQLINKKLEQLEKQNADMKIFVRDFIANGKMPIPADSCKLPQEKKQDKKSLSGDKIISMFYKGIGQQRITATKREKARGIYKKLRADNFTPEEIHFAVQWTLENANEQPYAFALIEDTIGQALAAREKAESIQQVEEERQKAVDREREDTEKEESERDKWEFYKAELPQKERQELRARATKELTDSGDYASQFMTDILIGIKETEILRRQFPEGVPIHAEGGDDD